MKPFLLMIVCLACLPCAALATSATPTQAAHATTSTGGTTVSRFDTKLPIEISSDSLEVLQHDNKAIFTGNVVAVQGTVRLKSDVMIVHYQQKNTAQNGKPAAPTPPATPAPAGAAPAASSPMGAITLIEVKGNVFVATPEESAKGDFGDYQVATKIIHLFGDNVILTREKNILRGTALEYNLNTGRSVLTNTGNAAKGTSSGRVRGVFIPADDTSKPGSKKPDKNKAAPAKTGATVAPAAAANVASPPVANR
jgi:lipopolysaccharide export system protein LptA